MGKQVELIRQLSKKWLETGDDSILDELKHAAHDGVQFEVFNGRILERYMEHGLELHVHFIWLGDAGSFDANICAVAQYGVFRRPMKNSLGPLISECDAGVYSVDGCKRKHPVLVDVHELIQNPQGMQVGDYLPALIRLQTLDECLRLNGHAVETLTRNLAVEPLAGKANGEHVFLDRAFVVYENQLPDNVIECGSKVVQTVTDHDAKREVGSRESETEMKDTIYVRVSLGNNMAFIQTARTISPYRCEVFFCPDDFLPNSIERMIHD